MAGTGSFDIPDLRRGGDFVPPMQSGSAKQAETNNSAVEERQVDRDRAGREWVRAAWSRYRSEILGEEPVDDGTTVVSTAPSFPSTTAYQSSTSSLDSNTVNDAGWGTSTLHRRTLSSGITAYSDTPPPFNPSSRSNASFSYSALATYPSHNQSLAPAPRVEHHSPPFGHPGYPTSLNHTYTHDSPGLDIPPMTQRSTRSPSNIPSTPVMIAAGGYGYARFSGGMAGASMAANHTQSWPSSATPRSSFNDNNAGSFSGDRMPLYATGTRLGQAVPYATQRATGQTYNAAAAFQSAPAFGTHNQAAPYNILPAFVPSNDQGQPLAPPAPANVTQGVHHNNVDGSHALALDEPQQQSTQAAASSADLANNNITSTNAASSGGIRSTNAGRITLPTATQAKKDKLTKSTNNNKKTSAAATTVLPAKKPKAFEPEEDRTCTVKDCDRWNKPFKNTSEYRRHERMHKSGWTPVCCPVCKKGFRNRKDSRDRHLSSLKVGCGAILAALEAEEMKRKDAEMETDSEETVPDANSSKLRKFGGEDDDDGSGGTGGVGLAQLASQQAGPSGTTWSAR